MRCFFLAVAFVASGSLDLSAEPVRAVHLDVATFFTVPQPNLPREQVETCFRIGFGQHGFVVPDSSVYQQKLNPIAPDLALSVLAEALPAGNVAVSVVVLGYLPLDYQHLMKLWPNAEARLAATAVLLSSPVFSAIGCGSGRVHRWWGCADRSLLMFALSWHLRAIRLTCYPPEACRYPR